MGFATPTAYDPSAARARRNTTKCDSEKLTTKLARIAQTLAAASCAAVAGQQQRHELGGDQQGRGIGDQPDDAGGDEGPVGAPAELAARFGREREHANSSHRSRDTATIHDSILAAISGSPNSCAAIQKTAKSTPVLTTPTSPKLTALLKNAMRASQRADGARETEPELLE